MSFSTGSRNTIDAITPRAYRSNMPSFPALPYALSAALPRPLPRTNQDPPYTSQPASHLADSAGSLRQRAASTSMTERSTYRASAILTCDNPGPAGAESKVSRSASGDLSLTLYPTEHMRAISSFPNRPRARHNFRPGDAGDVSPLSFSMSLIGFSSSYPAPTRSSTSDSVYSRSNTRKTDDDDDYCSTELSGVLTPRAIRHCHHRIFTGVYP